MKAKLTAPPKNNHQSRTIMGIVLSFLPHVRNGYSIDQGFCQSHHDQKAECGDIL
jgi:hypothetical protein